jgi:hypothetical protein
VVGANCVVTGDVPPSAFVAGAPARQIKRRLEWRPPATLDATRPEARPYLYSGFDIDESGEALTATASGEASVALANVATDAFELRLLADAPGDLTMFGVTQKFAPGEDLLRWRSTGSGETFPGTIVVPLRVAFAAPDGRMRLLRCRFLE